MKYEVYFNVSGKFGCVVDNINVGPDNPEGDLDYEGAEEIVKDTDFGPLENMKYSLDSKRFFANGAASSNIQSTAPTRSRSMMLPARKMQRFRQMRLQ
ncbi:MAG: hypothetical protein IKM88_14080 [Lachnospiraceae bacterium]|nr:hypothetical protein [Lachnospiraceae bacterium]